MTNTVFEEKVLQIGAHGVRVMCAGSGKNVVFLHGWGSSASAFLFAARRLADSFRVVLMDFAGFGESEAPEYPYGVGDYASDVLAALGSLGITSASFVGHSFGGRVCIELASKRPQIVESLALVDSAGLKPRRHLKYYVKILTHKLLKKLGGKGLKGSQDFRQLSPLMKETFKKVVNYDQTPLLCNIFCPTAIFWGKDDRETPVYMARKLNVKIKDSALFMLDGGHFAFVEDRDKFCLILRAFLLRAGGKDDAV